MVHMPDARKQAHAQLLSQAQSSKPLNWPKTIAEVPRLWTASVRNNLVGLGTHWEKLGLPAVALTISDASTLLNFLGELVGIDFAVAQVWNAVKFNALSNKQITVFTDSQYALKALQSLGQDSGQFLTKSISQMSHEISSSNTNTNIQFQWSPAHSKISGNDKAHRLAQIATKKGKVFEPSLLRFPTARSLVGNKAWEVKVKEDYTSLLIKNYQVLIHAFCIMANPRCKLGYYVNYAQLSAD